MWSIPGVGTDQRCDDNKGCPKRIDSIASPDCDDSFGVFGGDSCTVRCASDDDGGEHVEVWTCSDTDNETWLEPEEGLKCGRRKPKSKPRKKQPVKNLR